jgi:hypothetical protein
MKRVRNDLLGFDFASHIRAAALEMHNEGQLSALKRQQAAREHVYTTVHELQCLVFEERADPPVWRIETIQPGPGTMGIVTARDACERFLLPELRNVLAGKLKVYGLAKDAAEARSMACKYTITVSDTIRLRDSERFEGERS